MTFPRWPRAAMAFALLLLSSGCRRPTEEERLRAQVDVLSVHLYVGAKVAAAGDPSRPEIAEARAHLWRLREVAETNAGASQPSARELSAEAMAATRAALSLRALGQAEVVHFPRATAASRLFAPSEAPLAADAGPPPGPRLSTEADEHALLTVLLVVMKLHPRAPVPVPLELPLYEGRVTEAGAIAEAAIAHPFRGARAYVYAAQDYCDLASVDTAWLAEHPARLDPRVFAGFGRVLAHAPEAGAVLAAVTALPFALQLAAHGQTAACHQGRDAPEAVRREVRRLVDVCEAWGVPDTELAVLRAYLAYGDGDLERCRDQLAVAEGSAWIDEEGRAELRALREGLSDEPGLVASYYSQAFFVTWALRVAFDRLERAGALDALAATPAYAESRALFDDAARALEDARDVVPEADRRVEGLRGRFGCGR